jgi:hypothetical protein
MLYSFLMGQTHHTTPKHRLQLSSLLLLLVSVCSIGSPGSLKNAQLHHRSPASSSRTTRQLSRSRLGSSRTSAEAEAEPETFVASDVVSAGVVAASAQPSVAIASLTRALPAERMVCISCVEQDDPSVVSSLESLPHLGRAPPVA